MKRHCLAIMTAVVLSTISLAPAYTIIPIDRFTAGNPDLTSDEVGGVSVTENSLSGVIGGTRYTQQNITATTGNSADVNITTGTFNMSSGINVQADWRLLYGTAGNLDQNFGVAAGNNQIWLSWSSTTEAGADVTVELISDYGGGSQASASVTQVTAGGGVPQQMSFLFSDFLADNINLDFSDIDRINLIVDPSTTNWDGLMVASSFFVVPEPATMVLLGAGALALLARRRRRHV